jgi:hypothetical protein
MLTEINQPGTMAPSKARARVEPILRNRKKAELIVQKLGTPASLEAAATASGQTVQHADSLLFSSPYIPNLGQESKVIGSAFNTQLAGKPASYPIPGNGGVFVIKVDNVSAKPNPNADLEQQRFTQEQQQRSMISYGLVENPGVRPEAAFIHGNDPEREGFPHFPAEYRLDPIPEQNCRCYLFRRYHHTLMGLDAGRSTPASVCAGYYSGRSSDRPAAGIFVPHSKYRSR